MAPLGTLSGYPRKDSLTTYIGVDCSFPSWAPGETVAYLYCTCVVSFDSHLCKNSKNLYLSQDGWTSLHLAASEGYLEVCKLLCQYGADLSVTTNVSSFLLKLSASTRQVLLIDMYVYMQLSMK